MEFKRLHWCSKTAKAEHGIKIASLTATQSPRPWARVITCVAIRDNNRSLRCSLPLNQSYLWGSPLICLLVLVVKQPTSEPMAHDINRTPEDIPIKARIQGCVIVVKYDGIFSSRMLGLNMIAEIVPTQRKSNNAVTSLIIQGNLG
jgi:hypothetical protein